MSAESGIFPPEPEPAAALSGDALSAFARELSAEQPFRGYELGDCLAGSDRTAVFKAKDKNMDRTVVLKALRPCPERSGAVEEFFSQAGAVARVRHPGVARGLDAGRAPGAFFMAHEYVRGESLVAKVARRQVPRLTEKESLALAREIAGILQGLFDLGQFHGDLAPDRVVLGDGLKGKLLGIGFAWRLAWPDERRALLSRPDFLSPERINDEFSIDIRGDLYSLGCLWYWALLGEPVFKGGTPGETLDLHLQAKPVPPREADPRLSAATSQLLLWLLEKDRDARPRTPKDFLRRLAQHPLLADESGEGGEEKADGEQAARDVAGEASGGDVADEAKAF